MNAPDERTPDATSSSFRISSAPVVAADTDSKQNRVTESDLFCELPRSYGQSIVFAMARDPKTLFVYWDIDWDRVFNAVVPTSRKVYLRIYDCEGSEVDEIAVEPMARNCEVTVPQPSGTFRVEMGYYSQNQNWRPVGASENVTTPRDRIAALSPGDYALVPFHITFQRLTELFRATRIDQEPITRSLTRLQDKYLYPEKHGSLTAEEREVFRAMKATISERIYLPRAPLDPRAEMRLQKKLESILGFGVRASSHSLGGSSKV